MAGARDLSATQCRGPRSDGSGFLRLSQVLSDGQFDIVLAESLDRISQSIRDNVEFHSIGGFHGASIHSADVRGAARRRKFLLSGLLRCGQCSGAHIVAGTARHKSYHCANAKQKGPTVCTGMPALRMAVA